MQPKTGTHRLTSWYPFIVREGTSKLRSPTRWVTLASPRTSREIGGVLLVIPGPARSRSRHRAASPMICPRPPSSHHFGLGPIGLPTSRVAPVNKSVEIWVHVSRRSMHAPRPPPVKAQMTLITSMRNESLGSHPSALATGLQHRTPASTAATRDRPRVLPGCGVVQPQHCFIDPPSLWLRRRIGRCHALMTVGASLPRLGQGVA